MRGLAGVVRSDDVKAAIVLALRSTLTTRCLSHPAVPPPLPIPTIRSTRSSPRRRRRARPIATRGKKAAAAKSAKPALKTADKLAKLG
ncbi:hypothetical protein QZM92_26625, partial [Burkholderia multivorans]|nr:hypothetical protein [Burkholderia multivorans]